MITEGVYLTIYDKIKDYPINTPFGVYNEIPDEQIKYIIKSPRINIINHILFEPEIKPTKLLYIVIHDLLEQFNTIQFKLSSRPEVEKNMFISSQLSRFDLDYDLIRDKDIYIKESTWGYDHPSHHLKGIDLINYREGKIGKIKYILSNYEREKDSLKFKIQYRTDFIKEFKLKYFLLKKAFIKNCNMYEPGIIDEIIDIKAMQEILIKHNNDVIELRTKINKFEKFFDKYTRELLKFKFEVPFDEGGDKKFKKAYKQYKHLFI